MDYRSNLGQDISRVFHILAQFLFTAGETARLLSPEGECTSCLTSFQTT